MKANETPEKIYRTTTYLDNKGGQTVWKEQPVAGAENVEYTRTDAFIEKAAKWIRDNANNFLSKDIEGKPYLYRYGLAAEFIKAMMKE